MAEPLHRDHVVGHEQDRLALVAHPVEDVEALLLERRIADGQHLVDQQDVGVDLDRDREREPDLHAGRVVLELELLEFLQLREVDHRVEPLARLARGEPHHDPVHHDVVPRGEVHVEADAELDERGQPTPAPDPAVALVDAGDALEQRALAAAVASRDPEELTGLDRERDVLQRLERLVRGPACADAARAP